MPKKRLDILVAERGLAPSREKARAMIMAGEVLVDGHPATKAGTAVDCDSELRLRGEPMRFVSRGGEKLAGALDAFRVDPAGLGALDVGASTGGFTDCLLQRGARSVFAVDVGYGQLDYRLRNDPRVTVLEKTNARHLAPEDVGRTFELIVADVSFISLLKVLPALKPLLRAGGRAVALVKPQFEAGRGAVGKGGVVRKPEIHEAVLNSVMSGAAEMGFRPLAVVHSPLLGPKGNIEFFILMDLGAEEYVRPDAAAAVRAAHSMRGVSIDT
jgi:23S rRNA (cytidine1920-2'-O)/16S rRNA (cytidine1409-2'-O)-methyltransferase